MRIQLLTTCFAAVLATTAQIPFVKGKAIDDKLTEMGMGADSVSLTFTASKAATASRADLEVAFGDVVITETRGWLESAYVKFAPYPGATSYHVYLKGGQYGHAYMLLSNCPIPLQRRKVLISCLGSHPGSHIRLFSFFSSGTVP